MKKVFGYVVAAWLALSAEAGEFRYRVVRIDPPRPAGVLGIEPGIVGMSGVDINNRGEVVGEFMECLDAGCYTQRLGAFFYSPETGSVELLPDYEIAIATGINDRGQIALSTGSRDSGGTQNIFRYSPGIGFEPLPTLSGCESETTGINASGQVTGYSEGEGGVPYAFRFTDGIGIEKLGGLLGFGSRGNAINDLGWVVGGSAEHVFLFRDGLGMLDLGLGSGRGVNNAGAITGEHFPNDWDPHRPSEAFLWQDGQMRLLGRSLPPMAGGNTIASGLNDHNVVVGTMLPWVRAFIWTQAEGMRELNDLIDRTVAEDPAGRWHLVSAAAINEHGQIVGSASIYDGETSIRAVTYRLDPIPPQLGIQHRSTNLVVSWSPAWPGLVLESTENLSRPDWQPVNTRGTNVVSVPMESQQRFFRLNLEGIRGLCCPP